MSSAHSVPEVLLWGKAIVLYMSHIFWLPTRIIGTSLIWLTGYGSRSVKVFFFSGLDPNKKKSLENNLRLKFSDGLPFCHWIVLQFLHKLAFTTECQRIWSPLQNQCIGKLFSPCIHGLKLNIPIQQGKCLHKCELK